MTTGVPVLEDPDLPAVAELLAGGEGPLSAVLASAGSDLVSSRPVQVTWWPGSSITVRYSVRLRGMAKDVQMVAIGGHVPEGAVVVESGGQKVGVWQVPHDPSLPGLPSALDARVIGTLLTDLGLPSARVTTRLRAYRPGRRAVVEARTAGGRSLFLKLVPPRDVHRLHSLHRVLEEHLPVPRSLGLAPDLGLVVLESLPGETLRSALARDVPLPPAEQVVAVPRMFPESDAVTRSPIERLPGLSSLLRRIVPEREAQIDGLLEAIGEDDRPAEVPAHGDFYESQLLVSNGSLVGILDVDTHGMGRAGDDPATMIGHLSVLGRSSGRRDRVDGYARSLLRVWDAELDPGDLRRRAAATVLGLATGPFRVQSPGWPSEVGARLDLAARWIDSRERLGEKDLIAISRSPHSGPRH